MTDTALAQLAEHDAKVAEALARARAVTEAAQAARRAAESAREALTEAFAQGDEKAAAQLTKAKVKAEATAAEPWAERLAGAERAANRVKGERDAWLTENITAVLGELQAEAQGIADRIVQLGQDLALARKEWHATGQKVQALVAVAAGPGSHVVTLHIDQLLRDVGRAVAEGVPAPMPAGRQTPARVIPEHDPDPAVRERARADAERKARRVTAPVVDDEPVITLEAL